MEEIQDAMAERSEWKKCEWIKMDDWKSEDVSDIKEANTYIEI
jgi:hypothetical protein